MRAIDAPHQSAGASPRPTMVLTFPSGGAAIDAPYKYAVAGRRPATKVTDAPHQYVGANPRPATVWTFPGGGANSDREWYDLEKKLPKLLTCAENSDRMSSGMRFLGKHPRV